MKSILDDICRTLKKLREKAGYTQRQVADLLNIDRSTYSYYERGRTIPDLKTLFKLAEIFKEPIINLLGSEGKKVRFNDSSGYRWYDNWSGDADGLQEDKEILTDLPINEKIKDKIMELEEERYPKFSADLTDSEKEIVIGFRMMSYASQTKLKKNIRKVLKEEGILK